MVQIPDGLNPAEKVQFLSSAIAAIKDASSTEAIELHAQLIDALREKKIYDSETATAAYLAQALAEAADQ